MEDPWDLISAEVQEDWYIHAAAHDPKILATFEMFAKYDFSQATKDYILDDLERQAISQYSVPRERVAEVFGKAETKVWQEMNSDG